MEINNKLLELYHTDKLYVKNNNNNRHLKERTNRSPHRSYLLNSGASILHGAVVRRRGGEGRTKLREQPRYPCA